MSDIIGIELVGLTQLAARLDRMDPAVQNRLRVFLSDFGIRVREQVKANIVTNFHGSTGPLYQSVQGPEHTEQTGSITERVYTQGVPYAAIQEYGGTTPPHVILPKNGKVLAFEGRNGMVFARRVNHPGSRIPEQSYARLALTQLLSQFEGGIRQVVSDGVGDAFAVAAE